MDSKSKLWTQEPPHLIDVLRETMAKVEQTSGVRPDDPALVEVKNILNRRVADLEHAMATELSPAASESRS